MASTAIEAAEPDRSTRPELSVVVPVFDEQENLRPLDAEIRSVLRSVGRAAEIIYVDESSRDGMLSVLEDIVSSPDARPIWTRLVKLGRNFGPSAVMAAGFISRMVT